MSTKHQDCVWAICKQIITHFLWFWEFWLLCFFFFFEALNPPKIQAGTKNLRVIEEENKEVEIYVGTKLTVISETQVTVRCVSEMEPSPAISWKIRGKNSGFKNGVTLSKDNSTLTISYPGVEDSGDYACTASNNIGQDSKSSKIDILRKSAIIMYLGLIPETG